MPIGPASSGGRRSTSWRSGVPTASRKPQVVWQRAHARSLQRVVFCAFSEEIHREFGRALQELDVT